MKIPNIFFFLIFTLEGSLEAIDIGRSASIASLSFSLFAELLLFSLKKEQALQINVLCLLCLLPLWPSKNVIADDQSHHVAEAFQLLKREKYKQAQKAYSQTFGFHARFGEATACYRQKNYDCAIKNYTQAIWLTEKQAERAQAIFNLANTHFRNADFAQM